MAMQKKFLDQIGVSTLWARILQELDKKISKNDFTILENRVEKIETQEIVLYGGSAIDVMDKEEG